MYKYIYFRGADISDNDSLFGQQLIRFCQDSKLFFSSQILLPVGSYTYISEAWNTTSWLDHCICTADAHDSLDKLEILYNLATTDHIPISITLNVESLPEMTNSDNPEQRSGKLDWTRLSVNDLCRYKLLTEKSLSKIEVPTETIMCNNVDCENPKHKL